MNPGIIFAILTIFLFGSWAVPTKTLKIDPQVQAFWLTVGHFLLSVVIFLFFIQPLSLAQSFGPLIAGVFWAVGITSGYVGIKHLGITRALGIWIPIVLIVSALWGLIFFGEAKILGTQKLIQTISGILLLVIAALAVIQSSKGEKKLGNVKIGILTSITLGLIHGSFFVLLKTSSLPIYVSFLPLTIGMIGTTSLIVFVRKLKIIFDPQSILRMILAGLILGGGNYTALLTIQYLGVAQGYPLTQLGIIVNTL
jgi:glucose uptake protein